MAGALAADRPERVILRQTATVQGCLEPDGARWYECRHRHSL